MPADARGFGLRKLSSMPVPSNNSLTTFPLGRSDHRYVVPFPLPLSRSASHAELIRLRLVPGKHGRNPVIIADSVNRGVYRFIKLHRNNSGW